MSVRMLKRFSVVAALLSLPLSAIGAPNGLPNPDGAKELDGMQNDIARFVEAN